MGSGSQQRDDLFIVQIAERRGRRLNLRHRDSRVKRSLYVGQRDGSKFVHVWVSRDL